MGRHVQSTDSQILRRITASRSGQKQKRSIAGAALHEPEVIVMDGIAGRHGTRDLNSVFLKVTGHGQAA